MFNRIEKFLLYIESRLDRPILARFSVKTFARKWNDDNTIYEALKYQKNKPCNIKLLIVLTTYNRPSSCLRVIKSLNKSIKHKNMKPEDFLILVLNDKSESDYEMVRKKTSVMFGKQLIWLDAKIHHGKEYFWCMHQMAFLVAKEIKPSMYLYLQDDIDFSEDMLERLELLWSFTDTDTNRRVIYLFSDNNDIYDINGRWIKYQREDHPSGLLRKTQWLDLQGYYADLQFLKMLDFWIKSISKDRWKSDLEISSGVGRQITYRCFNKANIYQCSPSLITHGHEKSMMNPEARRKLPFDNRTDSTGKMNQNS